MAFKEKAVKRLAEKLNAAGVHYQLGAGFLMDRLGVCEGFHDVDVFVPAEETAAADKVLTRLGMRSEPTEINGCFRASYHFDGTEVDLCAGMAFDGGLTAVLGAESVCETVPFLGTQLPLGYPEDWFVWYALMGREAKVQALENWFRVRGVAHPERFRQCVRGELPESVAARVDQLLGS